MKYDCLIIDDEKLLADSTAEYFNLFGVKTAVVYNAAECREFFVHNKTDLLLLDIKLGDSNHTIIKPFCKLKSFAQRVAGGNLDIPLAMDRQNLFGSFTESFDLMRTELKKARIAEAEANYPAAEFGKRNLSLHFVRVFRRIILNAITLHLRQPKHRSLFRLP